MNKVSKSKISRADAHDYTSMHTKILSRSSHQTKPSA